MDVISLLNEAGITYHLEGGTLLGIVREGRLLPWDTDSDISIMRGELPKVMEILPLLDKLGWRPRVRSYVTDPPFGKRDLIRLIKVKDRKWFFFDGDNCLDIFVKDEYEGAVYWEAADFLMQVDKRYYDGYDVIEWRDITLKAPRHYKDYLTEKYGDWSRVDKDWACKMEGTIVRHTLP